MSKNHRHYVHLCTENMAGLLVFVVTRDGFVEVRGATKVNVSPTRLETHFKVTTGMSFVTFFGFWLDSQSRQL